MADIKTFQANIHEHSNDDITKYALFLGGLNVTRDALLQYDPLTTGFGRIFMIRKPIFLDNVMPNALKKFKHMLEYANTGVSGGNNISMQFNSMQGGYANRSMEIPNVATDDTNELTIKTYELSGSLMRTVIQMWISGYSDLNSGYATYHGKATELPVIQANHTAEFIYVVTDRSGLKVEYACLYANCFPKEIKLDHFNYESGNHELVPMDIAFTCTRYISPQINAKAQQLINKYNVLMNSLNFNSGYTDADLAIDSGSYYDINTGQLKAKEGATEGKVILNNAY